jgi:ribosomal protein S18 acetylase RimI-like enzyme
VEITIIKLGPEDLHQFTALINIFAAVFEMEDFILPSETHLEKVLQKEGFIIMVAITNEEVVGGLTAYTLPRYYAEAPILYIYDLGVLPSFQRKGIGKLLMKAILKEAKANGIEEVYVEADLEDDHAIEFYRSTGGVEKNVVMFDYNLS